MTDEDFLLAITQNPADLARRLVYADWLEERGDLRSEFLRIQTDMMDLPPGSPDRPALYARLQQIKGSLDANWVTRVSPIAIENCSSPLRCPKYWDKLTTTSDESVRFCERCREPVFFCSGIDVARMHYAVSERIAVSVSVSRWPDDLDSNVWDTDTWFGEDEVEDFPDK